ncbi:MAG TPA: NADH-quinone oxidoreductase subunit J [Candidatus Acidoferrales bacterium]|nr:NADH-quinone oxidoreductase subunit J [Candidatus Acidoferrales bacterium]
MMPVLFFLLALVAIGGAVSLILQKHPIHSALSLIVVMVAIAGLYLLLGAEFISAVQIIVYAGAIMVLFVFVIMLLNAGVEERTHFSRSATYVGVPVAVLFAATLAWWVAMGSAAVAGSSGQTTSTRDLSMLLFRDYAFPFELTSVLILIAIMGAIVLAKREQEKP